MILHPPPRTSRRLDARNGSIYAAARTQACLMSDPELAHLANALAHELASADDYDPATAEVARVLAGDRLQAVQDEQAARQARHHAGHGPDPRSRWTEAWSTLAREVRERADLPEVIRRYGDVEPSGTGAERHSSCPLCGGEDRFVLFLGPPPRFWCRQCNWRGDAISALRTLAGLSFADAVATLAGELGLPLPASRTSRARRRVITLETKGGDHAR